MNNQQYKIPKIDTVNGQCPQCGYLHPPLKPGEECPIKLAQQQQNANPNNDKDNDKTEKDTLLYNRQENEKIDANNITQPSDNNIDHVIKGIMDNLAVLATNRINELGLDGDPTKVHVLNKFRLILEQKMTDCMLTFIRDFKL